MNSKILQQRLEKFVTGEMRYYTPSIHVASFALPKFILNALSRSTNESSKQIVSEEVSILPVDEEVSIQPIEPASQE